MILGILALIALSAHFAGADEGNVDACKRQPFRGRCPSVNGVQTRSQFVLRFYLREGECVSYPFGKDF
ncbi:hypothetical protein AB6A40_001159 [Gnathostoma spinigerum]|uniref:Uncharacterized protein n=1 Tax=Gnathostoma spinigerum TaxID=75299 RepID=A0ABD6E3K6_9BILA